MPHKDPEAYRTYHKNYHAKNRSARNEKRKILHAGNKDAHREYCKRYREENSETVRRVKKAGYVKKRDTFHGRALILWRSAKQRARMRGEEFTLTLEYVSKHLASPCPKTGVLFDFKTLDRANPYAPSVDKIDRLKPYSNENVQIVCWAYNRMKSDMSDAELLLFCKLIAGVLP